MTNENEEYSLLSELKPGQTAKIIGYTIDNTISRRLVEMGLIIGREVHYVRNAPFKDPLQISMGSNNLMLRREQASQVKIELLDE